MYQYKNCWNAVCISNQDSEKVKQEIGFMSELFLIHAGIDSIQAVEVEGFETLISIFALFKGA